MKPGTTAWLGTAGLAWALSAAAQQAPKAGGADAADEAPASRTHRVSPAGTLWGIAGRYYGDSTKWTMIRDANPSIKDPHWIYPDQELVIPMRDGAVKVRAGDLAAAAPEVSTSPGPRPSRPGPGPGAVAPPRPRPPELSERLPDASPDVEKLNEELPETLSAYAGKRLSVPRGWSGDGQVVASAEDNLGSVGDSVTIRSRRTFAPGERLVVLRKAGEAGGRNVALQRVGMVQVTEPAGGSLFRAEVVKVEDAVVGGDYVVAEGALAR